MPGKQRNKLVDSADVHYWPSNDLGLVNTCQNRLYSNGSGRFDYRSDSGDDYSDADRFDNRVYHGHGGTPSQKAPHRVGDIIRLLHRLVFPPFGDNFSVIFSRVIKGRFPPEVTR
ncbi:MAG: hypothetical protein V1701_06010 [Planctomycetota bacterium]